MPASKELKQNYTTLKFFTALSLSLKGLVLSSLVLVVFSLNACSSGSSDSSDSSDPQTGFSAEIQAQLQAVVAQRMTQFGIPGGVVGVWKRGVGSWVSAQGLGDIRNGHPIVVQDRFRVGSLTKTFTVTVVLQLVDEGRLSLDTTLDGFLPQVPNASRITIRHLAGNTSGIYDYRDDPALQAAVYSQPTQPWAPEELVAVGVAHSPVFEPGARYEYSNTNFVILGMIVEAITGASIADEIQARILAPLGLSRTSYPSNNTIPEPYSHGYNDVMNNGMLADVSPLHPSVAAAAGAMISDIDDLKAWVEVLVRGDLLSPAMQQQRFSWIPTGDPFLSYGLGLYNDGGYVGHYGEIPGYNAAAFAELGSGTEVVILLNRDGGVNVANILLHDVTKIVSPESVPW